jgi:uncharacterized protein YndB with AHSA1/START domain
MPPMTEFATSIEIDAAPEFVFRFLTTNEGMTAWMGQWADLDPVQGGRFAVDIFGNPVRGEFLEVDPPHRVVVSWGYAGSDDLPPGLSRVAFTLTPIASGTRVDLLHTDLPERHVPGHARGWQYFTDRLALVAAGVDPGPGTWLPGDSVM